MKKIGRIELTRRFITIYRAENRAASIITPTNNILCKRHISTKARIQRISKALKNFNQYTYKGDRICFISVYGDKSALS